MGWDEEAGSQVKVNDLPQQYFFSQHTLVHSESQRSKPQPARNTPESTTHVTQPVKIL